jgi:hypothetical protein
MVLTCDHLFVGQAGDASASGPSARNLSTADRAAVYFLAGWAANLCARGAIS